MQVPTSRTPDVQLLLRPAGSVRRGYSAGAAGFVLGVSGLGNVLGNAVGGHIADKIGRRWTIVASAVPTAGLTAVVPFVEPFPVIVAVGRADRRDVAGLPAGRGCRAGRLGDDQLRDDQLTRMGGLKMIASIQPGIPGDLADEAGFPELVARGQPQWIARWRDLVESNVRTIGSTDPPGWSLP
jgi:hypothetical protein